MTRALFWFSFSLLVFFLQFCVIFFFLSKIKICGRSTMYQFQTAEYHSIFIQLILIYRWILLLFFANSWPHSVQYVILYLHVMGQATTTWMWGEVAWGKYELSLYFVFASSAVFVCTVVIYTFGREHQSRDDFKTIQFACVN